MSLKKDDLKAINGVGPAFEKRLNALGINTYAELIALTDENIAKLEESDSMTSLEEWHRWMSEATALASAEPKKAAVKKAPVKVKKEEVEKAAETEVEKVAETEVEKVAEVEVEKVAEVEVAPVEQVETETETTKEEAAPVKEEKAPRAKREATPVKQESATEEEVTIAEEKPKWVEPVVIETPHDEFDWSIDKRNVSEYTGAVKAEMEELYTKSLKTLEENTLVKGSVVSMTSSDVVLNVGFKSDGLVAKSEFRDLVDLKIGDVVDVYVVSTENLKGQLELSRKKAKLLSAWANIKDAYENDIIVKGLITTKTKGGLIADVFGLETFLPGSQIDVKPIIDYDVYVGKTMEFKVVKINESIKNAVVSHKALIESDIEEQRQEIISQLEKGQVLEGTIKNITDFGAFIDLGGVDGLLYITDISWGRINHPNEVLELNQKINVVVLEFDDNKKRISLGLKQLQQHPWDEFGEKIEVGQKVKGKIVNVEDYGAFLEIKPGVEGLIHVSEVAWSNEPINARDFFKLGDEHESIVMTIDREDRKMSLSLKQLTADPWNEIGVNFPVGSRHSGEVKNITPYGVFVELIQGIGGMVHISDLSWTKRFNHPSEFTKVGENIECVVLDIDNENRKLSLGHKQIEEDPWDTFESVFPEGSVHEATVLSKEEKGAIVLLPYGLEGFAPTRHLKKEDGSEPKADDKLQFKVIEFNRNDKRIILSHAAIYNEAMEEDKTDKKKSGAKKSGGSTNDAVKKIQSNIESSTLGDLDVLSKLKKEMESKEKKSNK
jgi:small subunit ribosomal protein S1